MPPDPTIEAAREIFDESVDHLREAIDGLRAEVLAWQPAGEDSNPITVLAVHGMHSSRWWLSIARGSPLPERDRPSEFVAESASDERTLVVRGLHGRPNVAPMLDAAGSVRSQLPSAPVPEGRAGHGGLGVAPRPRAFPRARGAGAADAAALTTGDVRPYQPLRWTCSSSDRRRCFIHDPDGSSSPARYPSPMIRSASDASARRSGRGAPALPR